MAPTLALLLVSLAASTVQQPNGAVPPAETSPMFRGDPAHRGVSASRLFRGQGGVRWRVQTGDAVRSTPAVTDDRVFAGSADGKLYAIDRASGAVRWRYDAGSPVNASPAVARGLVVVATDAGKIFAVDERTGRARWTLPTGAALPLNAERAAGWDFYVSSPVVVGSTVVIGSQDGGIYALDLATGRKRWRVQTNGRVRATPAVSEGTVVVGSFDGRVYALDLATGRERWVHRTIGDTLDSRKWGFDRRAIQSSAAIGGGMVFVGSRDGGLYGLDFATGERRWRATHHGSWVVGSPSIADGRVYVGSSDGHFVQAVDAATGTELWHLPTEANVLASPLVAGDALLAATFRTDTPAGELLALDRASGQVRWKLRLDPAVLSTPVVVGGEIYVGSDDGGVVAIGEVAPAPARLAVFYDSSLVRFGSPTSGLGLEYFRQAGYQVLGSDSLASFFTARIADGAPSAVVFAVDAVPASVAQASGGSSLFRRYLESGGKIVWLGRPPASGIYNEKGQLAGFDFDRSERLTGISYRSVDFDVYAGRPTATGARWGLDGTFRANFPLAASDAGLVLATDPMGRAVAWVAVFRPDRPGSGFVQLWGMGASADRLPSIQRVAEYGLLRPAER